MKHNKAFLQLGWTRVNLNGLNISGVLSTLKVRRYSRQVQSGQYPKDLLYKGYQNVSMLIVSEKYKHHMYANYCHSKIYGKPINIWKFGVKYEISKTEN